MLQNSGVASPLYVFKPPLYICPSTSCSFPQEVNAVHYATWFNGKVGKSCCWPAVDLHLHSPNRKKVKRELGYSDIPTLKKAPPMARKEVAENNRGIFFKRDIKSDSECDRYLK